MKQPDIRLIIAYRAFFALLALSAVIGQLVYGVARYGMDPVNFYSYFTIESNIFAVIIFLISAKALYLGNSDKLLDHLRGAAALYMTITGLIYSILLSGVDVNTPLPWVNIVLHYVFPVVVLADWLVTRSGSIITPKRALLWLIFPLAYFVYSLVRGAITGWYPYPFLNAGQLGYAMVAVNAAIIAAGMAVLALMLARLGSNPGRTAVQSGGSSASDRGRKPSASKPSKLSKTRKR